MDTIRGQGPAIPATGIDLAHDEDLGVTNPNLHRRVELHDPPTGSDEVAPRQYSLGIYGTHSYRTTTISYHDEDSETSEVP